MSDISSVIAGTIPRSTPETEMMKSAAVRSVSRTMPTRARNAAVLRVMIGVWTVGVESASAGYRSKSMFFSVK